MQKACVCGVAIPASWSLCPECLQRYGADRERWPPWLRFMVADIEREWQAERKHAEVLSFSEIGDVSDEDARVIV